MVYYTPKATALIVVSVVFPILAAIFVGLRVQTRSMRKMKLGADDYWIMAALFFSITGAIPYIIGACIGGLGQHWSALRGHHTEELINGKILYIYQFFYLFNVAAVRVSVIYFYKRVFSGSSDGFNKVLNGMLIVQLLWTISFLFATIFQAWPISYNWTGIGTPTNYNAMYFAQAGTEIVTDLLTLALPIPMIKSLHVDSRKKTRIIGIFWLGGFCVVASVVRLYYLTTIASVSAETDTSFQTVDILIWSEIEPCAAIICACLPILGPLRAAGATKKPEVVIRSVRSLFSLRSKNSLPTIENKLNSSGSAREYDDIVLPPMPEETQPTPNRWASRV